MMQDVELGEAPILTKIAVPTTVADSLHRRFAAAFHGLTSVALLTAGDADEDAELRKVWECVQMALSGQRQH